MSRFYASIQGNRGEATRQGTPKSGIEGHIRGWDVGIAVEGRVRAMDGDGFAVSVTDGSNGGRGGGRGQHVLDVYREGEHILYRVIDPDGVNWGPWREVAS